MKYFAGSVRPNCESVYRPVHNGAVSIAVPNGAPEHFVQSFKFLFLNQCWVGSWLVRVCVARPGEKNLKINENSEEGYRETEKRRETEESND